MLRGKRKQRFYSVSETELLEMLEATAKLRALEAGGVDNWNWYSDALREELELYINENPELEHFINDMENEGVVGYRDDFDYDELAKWELGFYEEAKET